MRLLHLGNADVLLLRERRERRERMGDRNADTERSDLRAGRRAEFDGPTKVGRLRVLVYEQRERLMPIGRQVQRISGELVAGIVAHNHRNVHVLRRRVVDRNPGRRTAGVIKGDQKPAGSAALQRHHRLLPVRVVTEDHKATHIARSG
jgi:hypothetical protein